MNWIYIAGPVFLLILIVIVLRRPKKSARPTLTIAHSDVVPVMQYSEQCKKLAESLAGKYKDVQLMAAGGMGIIALATQVETEKKVAIKTILPNLQQDKQALTLFMKECDAIKKLNHPNIIKILEVGESGFLYYVMEYLEGENLKQRMKRGSIPLPEVLGIGAEMAKAIGHCHDNRIIHRDVKPSNIFLCSSGAIKLIDFGIVKMIGDTALSLGTTRIGSPDFASPEQLQGGKISGKSDVYSLGVCLFYVLTGKLPYKVSDYLTKMFDSPLSLKELRPNLPSPLIAILNQAIDADPAKRCTSMDLWKALRDLKNAKPESKKSDAK